MTRCQRGFEVVRRSTYLWGGVQGGDVAVRVVRMGQAASPPGPRVGRWIVLAVGRLQEGGSAYPGAGGDGRRLTPW